MAPVSNGQVTSRDIRQQAVKTFHLHDDTVTEPKLVDQAVTVVKTEAPVDFASGNDGTFNTTITTTFQSFVSVTISVPAFSGLVAVIALFHIQVTAPGDGLLFATTTIAESVTEPLGQSVLTMTNTEVSSLTHDRVETLTIFGSSLIVEGWAKVNSGTNTANTHRLEVLAMFSR